MIMRKVEYIKSKLYQLFAGLFGSVEHGVARDTVGIAADKRFDVDIADVGVGYGVGHILVHVRKVVFARRK